MISNSFKLKKARHVHALLMYFSFSKQKAERKKVLNDARILEMMLFAGKLAKMFEYFVYKL